MEWNGKFFLFTNKLHGYKLCIQLVCRSKNINQLHELGYLRVAVLRTLRPMTRHFSNDGAFWNSSAVRLTLYFTVATLTTFMSQSESLVNFEDWTLLQWIRTGIASLISGLVAVRAFLDSSVGRNQTTPATDSP
jgi:hypothetical protein